jgi:protein-S-isoprenylcysteine O-methyltransferase Ste14
MAALRTFVAVVWVLFWVYWLVSAMGVKHGSRRFEGGRIPALLTAALVLVLLRVLKAGSLAIHSLAVASLGLVLLLAGIGLAVWARVHLGRNWGMPMTQKDEPELVTSGPYRFVRHPIYSGILLAFLGTALVTSLYWLLAFVVFGAYFIYAAKIEEGTLASTFPEAYARYCARTKMLVPFLL